MGNRASAKEIRRGVYYYLSDRDLYLIEQKDKRLFKFLERKAYMDSILMVDIVPDYQAPKVVDSREIKSLRQVCATVKK